VTHVSLKTKITVAVSLLTAVLLSSLAFSVHVFFTGQIKKLVYSQQSTTLAALAEQVDDKILTTQRELVGVASTMSASTVGNTRALKQFFDQRPDTLAMFDNGLFLFSPQGILLAGNPPQADLLERDFSARDYLKHTVASGKPQISEPFLSAQQHHHPIIMFTAPVFDRDHQLVGVLAGSLDLTGSNFLTKLGSVHLGERGYLYIYNSSRTMIVHKDRSRVFAKDVPPGANLLYDRALSGFEGTGPTVNSRKIPVISSFKRLKSTGWIIATNLPESEAYAPVRRAQHYLLLALFVVFACSIVAVWLVMKYLTGPLISFTRQIREITRGKAEQARVEIRTGDEIGLLADAFNALLADLEGQKSELQRQLSFSQVLIDSIPIPVFYKDRLGTYLGCNRAFEGISGLPQDQLVGKNVYQIAPQHLAEIYHQADLNLMREGRNQAYEAEVIYPDFTQHQVLFFKTVIPGADGRVDGIIGAMLDISERKQAEVALAAQKDFAESLVQNSVLPTFVLDSSHRVILWNRACEMITGVSAEKLLGTDRLWQVFYPQKRPLLADLLVDGETHLVGSYYQTSTQSGLIPEGVQAETWFRDQQGIGHFLTLNAAPIRDSQGTLLAVIQTLEDITERKLAQDAHDNTRRKMQLILDAAGDGIYGIDLDGLITFANPAAASLAGWVQEDLLGKHHSVLHHCTEHVPRCPMAGCPLFEALSDGLTRHVTGQEFWRKDGTSFPVEYISTPLKENGILVGAVVMYKDSTERRSTEEQLTKLSQAVMQSPVPIVITDAEGMVEFVNPRFTQLSGYELEEIVGQRTSKLKSGKTRLEVYQSLWSTVSCGSVWAGDLQNRHQNGDFYWVHCTISPIRNSSGGISHYMSFMESMTERKQLEEQLRQAQKMEAIGQLAGGVAHDFNNILTVIMGFGQLLQYTVSGDEANSGHIKQILDAANRASHLTSSLLAFSRKQVMLLQQVELNHLARNLTKFLSRIIGEDVTLSTELHLAMLPVMADPGQIEQVLMNLATNARDAMPSGGELQIRTDAVHLDQEFCRQHGYGALGDYALLTISDTGCGMDQDTQDKIFEPFFTTKPSGRGTGLGLSIVYGIIKQHGGYITLDSKPGSGTTFSIYLPLTKPVASGPAGQQPTEKPRGGHESILVVEDDPMVRNMVDAVLRSYGYRCLLAENGTEALAIFEKHGKDISLALLDVIMPGMNGKQVCEALRARSPQLKVLFLTGYTADVIKNRGILVDGIDLLLKPAQSDVLANKIREMLDNK
jgi:two-component system, NtrC family, sensor kinase